MSQLLQTEEYHITNNPDAAAVMAALGFSVIPTKDADESAPTAQGSIIGFRATRNSRSGNHVAHEIDAGIHNNNLPANHPGRAAHLGIQVRRALGKWRRGEIPKPHVCIVPGNNLAKVFHATTRTQQFDISPRLQEEYDPDPLEMELDHAAAAIVAGHGIGAMRPGGVLVTQRNAFNHSLRASTLAAACVAIAANPLVPSTLSLPGAPAGEHPFLYALMGIQSVRVLAKRAEEISPVVKYSARNSEKFALVTLSLLESPGPFRDHMHRHLKS